MAFISVTTETHLTELVVGTPLRDNYLTLFYIVVHHYNQLTAPLTLMDQVYVQSTLLRPHDLS